MSPPHATLAFADATRPLLSGRQHHAARSSMAKATQQQNGTSGAAISGDGFERAQEAPKGKGKRQLKQAAQTRPKANGTPMEAAGNGQSPQKPTHLPFHEALGQELMAKFHDISHSARRPPVATSFWTGIVEGDQPAEEHVPGRQPCGPTYSLQDLKACQIIEALVARHGRTAHMGVRDHDYTFFLNRAKTGVVSYRLMDHAVAVMAGDPIGPAGVCDELRHEFAAYCKSNGWQWVVQGAGRSTAHAPKRHGWTTVEFARELVLNVQTNAVLLGSQGKRIRTQCRQLQKACTVGIYFPAYGRDSELEQQMADMYDGWRHARNTSGTPHAYVTVFDLLSFPRLMIYVYAHDAKGKLLGFAALRRLGDGYHIDPITLDPDAPRGMTDLLLMSSMALLKESNVSRLVLCIEPLGELGEITGMSSTGEESVKRKSHSLLYAALPVGGKKIFIDRFRPDDAFTDPLYIVYPNSPTAEQEVAIAHFWRLPDALLQHVAQQCEQWIRESMQPAGGTAPVSAGHGERAKSPPAVRGTGDGAGAALPEAEAANGMPRPQGLATGPRPRA